MKTWKPTIFLAAVIISASCSGQIFFGEGNPTYDSATTLVTPNPYNYQRFESQSLGSYVTNASFNNYVGTVAADVSSDITQTVNSNSVYLTAEGDSFNSTTFPSEQYIQAVALSSVSLPFYSPSPVYY